VTKLACAGVRATRAIQLGEREFPSDIELRSPSDQTFIGFRPETSVRFHSHG
jgi:hypothetical protein